MRRLTAGFLFLILFGGAAHGQPPADVKIPVGRLGAVSFDTAGRAFAYEVLGDLDAFREYDADAAKVRLRLIGYRPGTHWLVVALAGEKGAPTLHKCKVTVGDDPGPGPGPKPNPPEPTDPLYLALKAAWAKEVAADSAKYKDFYAAVYQAAGQKTVYDPALTTLGAVLETMRKAAATEIPAGALPELRRAVGAYLTAEGLGADAALTDAVRQKAGAAFLRVSAALEALK